MSIEILKSVLIDELQGTRPDLLVSLNALSTQCPEPSVTDPSKGPPMGIVTGFGKENASIINGHPLPGENDKRSDITPIMFRSFC
ncbi:hypothetical protein PENSTE_c023G08894 [Penicillium steckii]|uniref:Uncharacterized protein n=1 Tax=Penicillium steckii TaxID=303698 RepID=A0A1V6SRR2_9EURO|nr:hypothetical protein PENSTE_c023G08894 [Penicillium steckii]